MKKYPRTLHISFSPQVHEDDKIIDLKNEDQILKSEINVSVKLDGGNCCIKHNGVYARTHTQETNHQSFDYIKNKHYYGKLDLLNPNYLYFGENMYAVHSIEYIELKDYFYLFNIFDSIKMEWLSVNDLEIEAKRCQFEIVPSIFKGHIRKNDLKKLLHSELQKKYLGGDVEGFVIRKIDSFKEEDFNKSVMKYVRKNHIQTDSNWNKNWKNSPLLK